MKGSYTFTMIKPDAVRANYVGDILSEITRAGFRIPAMKVTKLSLEDAKEFYSAHQGKPFYEPLCEFMSSGPIVAAVLMKENAIDDYRELIGKTDPQLADEGTIRKKYAKNIRENAVHGSDCEETAAIESSFFFSERECYQL